MVAVLCGLLIHAVRLRSHEVTVTVETYKIWHGCFRITNGIVDLVVVPQVGRIMRFGEVGEPNILFEAPIVNGEPPSGGGWKNWGGDKVWPAPQSAWVWPPETEYDGSDWEVHAIPNGVRMASKSASSKLGVRFERTILLKSDAPAAEMRTTLFNASTKTVRFAAWDVCQVNDPTRCFLPTWKSKRRPKGWKIFGSDPILGFAKEHANLLLITRDPKRGHKYGSGSAKGAISAEVGKYRITIASDYDPRSEYPDDGCAQQVYTSADPTKYAELELTGPLTTLRPGQATSLAVTMTLKQKDLRQ